VVRRSGLGRGLGALIPTEVVNDRASDLAEIPVGAIEPNPAQPRSHFDEEMLASLAASIREVGVLQPVLVRPLEGGRYQLVAGERRWRAARRVGLQTIPALIRTVPDESSLEHALVENLHRQDLNPLEEAAAYQQLVEGFGLTHDQVAERVGRSRAAVSNTLRLFQLPPAIQRLVMDGALSAGHARALLGTPDRAFQESLARRAVHEQLSVRSVEDAVRERNELAGATGPLPQVAASARVRAPTRAPADNSDESAPVHALEELLSEFLDTRVKIELGARKSRLMVEFADLDDLERIYRRMIST
jgi:ParB family transcriptional regulator, chromosome partitioning protein